MIDAILPVDDSLCVFVRLPADGLDDEDEDDDLSLSISTLSLCLSPSLGCVNGQPSPAPYLSWRCVYIVSILCVYNECVCVYNVCV
eukprot:m.28097 g.28097  ORF g.28097 m.28097 type:complete len:86 (-) comp10380_c0_seq1:38-295(-)